MPVAKQSNFVQDNPDYSANSPKTALLSDGVRLFLVAGTSSLAAKTSVAPLDRGRIIAQTGVGGSASSSGVISIFRHVLRSEGPLGLWCVSTCNSLTIKKLNLLAATNVLHSPPLIEHFVFYLCAILCLLSGKATLPIVCGFFHHGVYYLLPMISLKTQCAK